MSNFQKSLYVLNRYLIILFVLLFTNNINAQNTAPEVTNVTFSQRDDNSFIVDVYYDINDINGDLMSVKMYASDNAGDTWNFSCENVTGDWGPNISSGLGKHIVWDFGAEHPQVFGDQFQIKIIANDRYLEWGTLIDIDGNVYKTVKIGNQWWMAENLKVTRYRNGDAIPNVADNTGWANLTTGAWCVYNNDNGNISTHGLLYNWYAVDDSRNIAPIGWHVPTDDEWKELEMYLGMSQCEADSTWWYRGTDEGSKLKAEIGWSNNGNGTNASGFTALPGGLRRYNDGNFFVISTDGYWWSSTERSSIHAWPRLLYYYNSAVGRLDFYNKLYGFSLRLIRD